MVYLLISSIILSILSLLFLIDFLLGVFFKKKVAYSPKEPHVKFTSLIAARNEETVISGVIESLLSQNYPKELNDIYVLINNTTDNTKYVAEKSGAIVIECPDYIKSKGQALRYIFQEFEKKHKDYDAYCVFDADNIVDSLFLQKMNDCYMDGYHVAQGYRDSRNILTSFNAFSMTSFFTMINYAYNEGHRRIGLNAGLNGTGLMIGADVIQITGYDPKTLVEDMEFTAVCAINHIKIAWVHDALVKDEQPDNFKTSIRQRRRWNAGQLQCLRRYSGQLLKKRNLQCFEAWLYLFGAIHMSLSPIILIINGIVTFVVSPFPIGLMAIFTIAGAAGAYIISIIVFTVFLHIRKMDLSDDHFKLKTVYIMALPFYYIFWSFISLSALIYPPKTHEYIKHYGIDDERGRI